jgi:CheY-like chemotaxis protein
LGAERGAGGGPPFSFPIAAARGAPAARPAAPRRLDGRVALVVDDNASCRRVLADVLAASGLRVETAAGPAEALDLVARGLRFDLAVVDLEIPGADGVDLAAALRGGPSGAAPLVLLAPAARRRERRVAGAGFFAALAKPAKAAALRSAVSKALGQGADAPESSLGLTASGSFPAIPELRILLAEDVAVNQKVALKMLERLGHRADVAANGVEVLRALERQRYEVVLMDVQMPEMDGLEATRQIRALWGADGPRVIAMTANAMEGDRERCLEAGMDGYVSKPVRQEDLARALMRAAALATR